MSEPLNTSLTPEQIDEGEVFRRKYDELRRNNPKYRGRPLKYDWVQLKKEWLEGYGREFSSYQSFAKNREVSWEAVHHHATREHWNVALMEVRKEEYRKELTESFLPWHHRVEQDIARFIVVNGGRRIRKTEYAMRWLLLHIFDWPEGAEGWFLAPTYRQAKDICWDRLLAMIPRWVMTGKPNRVELTIPLLGNRKIALKGCDRSFGRRGLGPSLFVFDEFAYCAQESWEQVVRPAIADKEGKGLFLSSPWGKNHFYHAFLRGAHWLREPEALALHHHHYSSYLIPTAEVGTVKPEELAEIKKTTLPDVYAQEFECRFLGEVGLVIPEFINRPWPEGNLLPTAAWEEFRQNTIMFCSLDWGASGYTFILWWKVDAHGRKVVFDECVMKAPSSEEIARAGLRHGEPYIRLLDRDCFRLKLPGAHSVAEQLALLGFVCCEADVRFDDSVARLRSACLPVMVDGAKTRPMFMIVEGTCHTLTQQLGSLQYNRHGGKGSLAVNRGTPHDGLDAARYGIMHNIYFTAEPVATPTTGLRLNMESPDEYRPVSGLPA